MKQTRIIFQTVVLVLGALMSFQLSAQTDTLSQKPQTAPAEVPQVDSAQVQLMNLQKANDSLQKVVDSLNSVIYEQYGAILRSATAMLYRPYYPKFESFRDLLMQIPDSLMQNYTYGMWNEINKMIESSQVDSVNLRRKVEQMLLFLPRETFNREDFRIIDLVMEGIDKNYPLYDAKQHAIELLQTVSDSVQNVLHLDFKSVIELLTVYKESSEEIHTVLEDIVKSAKNGTDYDVLKKKLTATQYYKKYYNQKKTIPYLNGVIENALEYLDNGDVRKLQELLKKV